MKQILGSTLYVLEVSLRVLLLLFFVQCLLLTIEIGAENGVGRRMGSAGNGVNIMMEIS